MSTAGHVRLFTIAAVAWVLLWLAGWPSYYQQYSTVAMIWFEVILLVPVAAIAYFVLIRVPRGNRMRVAGWIAFYFSVPIAFYDWLYCGLYLGHGAAFLWRYWYLTTYYVVPWIFLPGTARLLNKGEQS